MDKMNINEKRVHLAHRSRCVKEEWIYIVWVFSNKEWIAYKMEFDYASASEFASSNLISKGYDYKITETKISSDSETMGSYFKELETNAKL